MVNIMDFYNPRPEGNFFVDKILKWITDVVVIVIIAVFFAIYLCDEATVVGSSMASSLEDGQVVLINKMAYKLTSPERYDVIVYKSKTNDEKYVIKRIIGLPGEKVKIEDSKIYINGEAVEDEYFNGSYESGQASTEIELLEGEYFVLGDNRNLSEDSRFDYIGNIYEEDIVGKAWLIASPFNDISFVK